MNDIEFSLIICTYMRPNALAKLMHSVVNQTVYPSEIIIIDGSTNTETQHYFNQNSFKNLKYFLVSASDRGLTKQRNVGISKLSPTSQIVCFLDDDTVLTSTYFQEIIKAFQQNPNAAGIGGVALNENKWLPNLHGIKKSIYHYTFEEFFYKESSRNVIRNILRLNSNELPSVMPTFSHGRTCGYPITGKVYPVDLIVGMSMNFSRKVINNQKFSTYFEGYGLYEDADFCLRALQYGQNYIATAAQLYHYHDALGRPNQYKYGKMVVRNGWYVWRIKYPNPSLLSRVKWNITAFLLTLIRALNVLNTNQKKEAFTEALGRTIGWFSLLFNKPKMF